MIRITVLLWVALLVVAGGTVMNVSYRVRHVERHIAELQRDSRQEQEAIRVLGAEWDTLNDPQRIDGLSRRYLPELESTPIRRVVALDNIPFAPSDALIAKADAVQPGKNSAAGRKPEIVTKAARPTIAAAAGAPAVGAPAVDGVGLILARVERRE